MKRLSYIILTATIAILFGCKGHEAFKASLDRADSILNINPDSAFSLLCDIKTEAAFVSKPLQMRYLLLWAQSCNKTYRQLPSADTLQTVLDYYDDNGNERMTSLYMMGCLYRDSGDVRKALKYFNEAAAGADTTDSGCDFYTLSRIYSQMTELFHRQKAPRFELEYSYKAEHCAWKAKDTLGAVTLIHYRNMTYQLLKDTDSVYYTCKRAETMYRQIGRYREASWTMPPLIDIYLSRDSLLQAKQAIGEFEQNSGWFDKNNEIRSGAENYYGLKGRYYMQSGHLDSAIYFYHKMLKHADKIDNLKDGYNGLLAVYRHTGEPDSVVKYTRLSAVIADSIKRIYSPEQIALWHADYYANRSGKLAIEHKLAETIYAYGIILAAVILTISGCCIWWFIKCNQSVRQKIIESERRKVKKSEEKYAKAKYDFASAKNRLDKEIKTKTQKISELEKTINAIQEENYSYNGQQHHAYDENMADCLDCHLKKLKICSQKGGSATKEDLMQLRYLASECDSGFFKHISSQQYDLTDRELFICIFIRYEFKPAEISVLLNISSQQTTNLRTRINHKLFDASGTKHLDDNLKRLNS